MISLIFTVILSIYPLHVTKMTRLCLLYLILVCLCFSIRNAEIIVSDNLGDIIALPLSGGNETGGFTINDASISTSPYILNIYINDIQEPSFLNISKEQFFIYPGNPLFGTANLSAMFFLSANATVPVNASLGTALSPNHQMGTYSYIFMIPQGGWVQINISYNSTQNPYDVDLIYITVNNPVLSPPPQIGQGLISGDPLFVGLRGQKFQIHGVDGGVYNLISEPHFQVNSRFVFLSSGQCPSSQGRKRNCWTHPGSYLGELGLQYQVHSDMYTILIVAGRADQGFEIVRLNGQSFDYISNEQLGSYHTNTLLDEYELPVSDTVTLEYTTRPKIKPLQVVRQITVVYLSRYEIYIETDHFKMTIYNSDLFVNQEIESKVPWSTHDLIHGLLGQTARSSSSTSKDRIYRIEGMVDDYLVIDEERDPLFGYEFMYNQFDYTHSPLSTAGIFASTPRATLAWTMERTK